jgi:phosphoribosylformylglycinamidine (FGAM) synthase-like amidotransferase family enzyme
VKRGEIRICVLRVGGTNCDAETRRSFRELGVQAEVVHINEMIARRSIFEYNALVFPGGFSYGDYVRAGAIWAKWIVAKLVEAGLLPAFEGTSPFPEAALATNDPPGYNCRWISLIHENSGRCAFTSEISKGKVLQMPVAHGEGRFLFAVENEKRYLEKLYENDQLVFRYCHKNGEDAGGAFPTNPNGSFRDIAGICNPAGNVFGMMPHPERAFYWWQQPDWTRRSKIPEYGDGKLIFESLVNYLERKA